MQVIMACAKQDNCMSGQECTSCRNQTVCMSERSGLGCGTPSLNELIVELKKRAHCCQNKADEVWPNLYLGTASAARDLNYLQCMGITHVLNVADNRSGPYSNPCMPISYYGVQAVDLPSFDISQYFCETSKFIDQALKTPGGKVLVHCCDIGLSRNSTIVLAYLMIYRNRTLMEAICLVTRERYIRPNDGFLQQLRNLDMRLSQRRKLCYLP
ncbi:dual specificity protein phosphatase 13A-like [Lissotriton helveticus]